MEHPVSSAALGMEAARHIQPEAPASFASNPSAKRIASTNRIARGLDRDDAPALGVRKVLVQVSKDLFGTKDVQNVITASYVWLADQVGHVALGLVPTLLACW